MKIVNNKKISKIIEEIGEMLEIIGNEKDQFRIIAFQNAARKIEMMSREIGDIYAKDGIKGIKNIKGIGESIAEKIEELLKTGKCKYHDELLREVAPAILKFITIPGVGPHIAKSLYDSYKVKNISELKKALQEDKSEKHFKEKTKENILEGIELLSKQTSRMLLSFAEPIAEEIISAIKNIKEVSRADSVGSLRRMKETVGDIDIVVSVKVKKESEKLKIGEKVINKIIKMPFVRSIIEAGSTKVTFVHKKGPNIDIEILPEEEYGSLLQHFTGSKEHNVALRTWAEKNGFSLSEHGIKRLRRNDQFPISNFQTNKENIIKCQTEEKFYKTLGMEWIAPELRENRGEIEASFKHKLPKLIESKDIKGDLHLHSIWSEGELSIQEIADIAIKKGYEYIAITDHTAGLGITHGLSEKDIPKYIHEIQQINSKHEALNSKPQVVEPDGLLRGRQIQNSNIQKSNLAMKQFNNLTILSGAEVNILADGSLDISDKMLAKLDIVIASIHSGFRQDKDKITKRLIKAIQNPNVDIIGHPSGRLINQREPLNLDWERVFHEAKINNVKMEINSHPQRLDLNDELIILAKKYNNKFAINSDSHQKNHFNQIKYGISVARRGWLEKDDVINALNFQELIKSIRYLSTA